MIEAFHDLNDGVLDTFGETVLHFPGGESEGVEVTVIREDPTGYLEDVPGNAMIVFGAEADFATRPDNADEFEIEDIRYRVHQVREDHAGGLHLILLRA